MAVGMALKVPGAPATQAATAVAVPTTTAAPANPFAINSSLTLPYTAPAGPAFTADFHQKYQSALQANQDIYNRISSGYATTAGDLQAAQNAALTGFTTRSNDILSGLKAAQDKVTAGYDALGNRVDTLLVGTGDANAQQIRDDYALSRSRLGNSAIGRGLGNTTVLDNLYRGSDYDREKALVANANTVAQNRANYASSIGLAGLGYQGNAAGQYAGYGMDVANRTLDTQGSYANANANLATKELDWMNTINIPYPDQAVYMQQYQQQQNALLAAQQRADQQKAIDDLKKAGYVAAPTGGGGISYAPGPTHGAGPQGDYGGGLAQAAMAAGAGPGTSLYTSALAQDALQRYKVAAAGASKPSGGGGGGGTRPATAQQQAGGGALSGGLGYAGLIASNPYMGVSASDDTSLESVWGPDSGYYDEAGGFPAPDDGYEGYGEFDPESGYDYAYE